MVIYHTQRDWRRYDYGVSNDADYDDNDDYDNDDDGDAGDDAGDAGDGSGDGMLRIHPLTRSHCHTVTRTLGRPHGHSFIHSFIHSFVHSLFIHTVPRSCIQ
jgi:hypothetical protein